MPEAPVEGKWLAVFRRVFSVNGIGPGTKLAIVAETQSRPALVHLSERAACDLGADFSMTTMRTRAKPPRCR